jgi:hypothetical protein
MDLSQIYPYIVPSSWVAEDSDQLYTAPITADVQAVLVTSPGRGVTSIPRHDELDDISAFEAALHNVSAAWMAQRIQLGWMDLQPGIRIGVAEGTWLAPALLLDRQAYELMCEQLGSERLIAVVPNQECLLLHAAGLPAEALTLIDALIGKLIGGHAKPVSTDRILLDGGWPQALPVHLS